MMKTDHFDLDQLHQVAREEDWQKVTERARADLGKRFDSEGFSPAVAEIVRGIVYGHYRRHRREFPWRQTRDPYAILVSEVMLQQTQVERVAGKFREFVALFPRCSSLAAAPLQEVLACWQGLGYNRRAVNLKHCAEAMMERWAGEVPASVEELQTLPGIGPYTARAVAAFAFDLPTVFIETNIRAVFIHLLFPGAEKVHDRELLPLVEASLDREHPREWYSALMDYGAFLKREHPNPSRRSAHHVRQSPFRGSNREVRGKLLKAVLECPGLTAPELAGRLLADADRVETNLRQLCDEGFLVVRRKRFFVA
jgi:A/G-specific adenine glycosylase